MDNNTMYRDQNGDKGIPESGAFTKETVMALLNALRDGEILTIWPGGEDAEDGHGKV